MTRAALASERVKAVLLVSKCDYKEQGHLLITSGRKTSQLILDELEHRHRQCKAAIGASGYHSAFRVFQKRSLELTAVADCEETFLVCGGAACTRTSVVYWGRAVAFSGPCSCSQATRPAAPPPRRPLAPGPVN